MIARHPEQSQSRILDKIRISSALKISLNYQQNSMIIMDFLFVSSCDLE